MKSLKLTNLNKMQQQEMQQIKGGEAPFIYICHTPRHGEPTCWCAGVCTGHESRAGSGKIDSQTSAI